MAGLFGREEISVHSPSQAQKIETEIICFPGRSPDLLSSLLAEVDQLYIKKEVTRRP